VRNVLVTGGAGFIGCNFVRFLLATEPLVRIVTLDALTYAGSLDNLADIQDPTRHTFIRGDICNQDLVVATLRDHRIDTVVNFAAETHVDRSIAEGAPFLRTNVLGAFSLLEAARKVWLEEGHTGEGHRFHHISTDEVYGSLGPDALPFREDTPYAPNSPYAASKAAADHLVRAYVQTYGLPATVTNCSNNYGPFQYPEKLIPLMILNALEGKPLPVYGDGQQVRDWLHVLDHVEAVWLVLRKGSPGETYNIGGGVQITNLDVVRQTCRLLDEIAPDARGDPWVSRVVHVADRPGHDRRYAMDASKIRRELGWRPRFTFESGLRETVRWYLDHPEWVAAIRGRPEYQAWLEQNYARRSVSM